MAGPKAPTTEYVCGSHDALCCLVCAVPCRAVCRQQRELADVELSRLSPEVQAAAAAAADAQGLLAAAEATARKEVESARHALLKVWPHLKNSQHTLCVQPHCASPCLPVWSRHVARQLLLA